MAPNPVVPLPPGLSRNLEEIEIALQSTIRGEAMPDMAARYAMGWLDQYQRPATTGGKRLRPALCLLIAEALGQPARLALPGALAIELVHNFSLVHDDLQDRDTERHGRPTAWVVFGEAQAINLGDYLSTKAFSTLLDAAVEPARCLESARLLNDAVGEMIKGQWRDIEFESGIDVSVEDYFAMVSGKTGALLAASAAIGATLAGADRPVADAFAAWARQLGLAFQVRDDYLGIWGATELTGKAVGADIRRRKRSMPILMGMADPQAGPIVREAYKNAAEPDVERVMDALEGAGIAEAVVRIASEQRDLADALLARLPVIDAGRSELREASNFLVDRIH
jgi:geranylgeranyl diphosphate synthase, type I